MRWYQHLPYVDLILMPARSRQNLERNIVISLDQAVVSVPFVCQNQIYTDEILTEFVGEELVQPGQAEVSASFVSYEYTGTNEILTKSR
jgi:tRNA A-37 threonylcarbamoyl transferase component Bud32